MRAQKLAWVTCLVCAVPLTSFSATISWNTDSSGLWTTPANWSTAALPGANDDVVLDRGNADPVITYSYNQDYSIRSLLVNESLILRDSVPLQVATTTTLNNTLQLINNGVLKGGTLNTGAQGRVLVPPGGSGRLDSLISNVPIDVQSGSITFAGPWRNNGTLTASNSSVTFGGTFNTEDVGTFNRTGGSVYLTGTMNNTGRTLLLNAATGSWNIGGTIVGGSVVASDGITPTIGGTLDAVSLQADSILPGGSDLNVQNGLTLGNSTITVQGGNATNLWFRGSAQTLGGTGQIAMSSNVATLFVAIGSALTIGPGITVRGGGTVAPNAQTMVNQGSIVADNSSSPLFLQSTHGTFHNEGLIEVKPKGNLSMGVGGPGWSNTGLIRVSGGTITMTGTFDQSTLGPFQYVAGTVNASGTIANVGKTLALSADTGSWTLYSCTVAGGRVTAADGTQLNASASDALGYSAQNYLSNGVILDTPLAIPAWSRMTVTGGLTVNRAVTLAGINNPQTSYLDFSGTQTLGGAGEVAFNTGNFNFLRPTDAGTLTIGPAITVRTGTGGGTVGNTPQDTAVINQGTISAQTAGKSLSIAGAFTNAGTIEARNGATVLITAPNVLSNLNAGTLTGGAWRAYAGSTVSFGSASVSTNDASVLLSGPGSSFPAVNSLALNRGDFTITGGRDFSAPSFTNAGVLAVGAASDFSAPSFAETAGATTALEVLGTGSEQFGQIAVTGPATLAGTLSITLTAGFVPHPGDIFAILSAGSLGGSFSSIDQPTLDSGRFDVSYSTTGVTLVFVPEPATALFPLAAGAMALIRTRRRHT